MKTILFTLVSLFLCSCVNPGIVEILETSTYVVKSESKGRIKVEGKAVNSARGATIIKKDGMFYVLDGIQDCPEKYYQKNVTVSGHLYLVTQTPKDTNEAGVYSSSFYKIKKPKYLKINSEN